jgi:hypothetical protein
MIVLFTATAVTTPNETQNMLKERKNITFEKSKAKMTLCSIKHYVLKTWGSGGIVASFMASVIDGGH